MAFAAAMVLGIVVLAPVPHGIENFFMVFAPLLAGGLLVALPFISNRGERSRGRRPWAMALVLVVVASIAALWRAGIRSDWSRNFNIKPLPAQVVGATAGPIFDGSRLFELRGRMNCHLVQGYGGRRGPDLSFIGDKLSSGQMVLRIANGGNNMPAFASSLSPKEIDDLTAFLGSRRARGKAQ